MARKKLKGSARVFKNLFCTFLIILKHPQTLSTSPCAPQNSLLLKISISISMVMNCQQMSQKWPRMLSNGLKMASKWNQISSNYKEIF